MKPYLRIRGGFRRLMTLPALLAAIELALLPPTLWLCRAHAEWAAPLLLASALIDLCAWALIHRFGMGDALGCKLAPAANALGMAAALLCLSRRARRVLIPAALLLIQPFSRRLRAHGSAPLKIAQSASLFALALAQIFAPKLSAALATIACASLLLPLARRARRSNGDVCPQ